MTLKCQDPVDIVPEGHAVAAFNTAPTSQQGHFLDFL